MDQNAPALTPTPTAAYSPTTVLNPLLKHFRNPSLYLKLPSQGSYWGAGSLTLPVTGELPILPMTTRDEITLKTPDALLNGQGVINVIESCCPSITNAWEMPSVDVDAIVIAIRIASYGHQMDFGSECPHCGESNDYAIDLREVLEGVISPDYTKVIVTNGLTIKLKPQNYLSITKSSLISFEEQQLLKTLGSFDAENKQQMQQQFDVHLTKLIELNINTLTNCTDWIKTDDGVTVTDESFINEFYANCDNQIIKKINAQLAEFTKTAELPPHNVTCSECSKQFKVGINFDWASFFANGS